MNRPRIVIAGTHSGVGKTSVTLAVAAALRKRGLAVQTFKVGPDFLDPTYLTTASGRPCYNLDGWMAGSEYVRRLFARASENADISVVEGVMGFYDGADPASSEGSTAEIARWLDAPVLLITDVYGMARSIGAIVKGYAGFEEGLKMAGVIANRSGSEHHARWLADSLASASLPPLVGAIPTDAFPHLPSRHLGLITASSDILPQQILDELAAAFERHACVDDIISIARNAPSFDLTDALPASAPRGPGKSVQSEKKPPAARLSPARHAGSETGRRIFIGVAFDAAFHFYYRDLFDELERMGCTLMFFSPISDRRLPDGLDALYFGGGYPEMHAEALAANREMLSDIREFASSGRPVYAECGGLMYLCRDLETTDGARHAMAGVIPASTRMLKRLKSLAYVEVTLNDDSLWGSKGTKLRGHEFHYSELTSDPTQEPGWSKVYAMKGRRSGDTALEGFQNGRVLASYAHLHLPSHPHALQYFIDHCRAKPRSSP
jgi:cobyrinic acid a,c-diamide synthase